MAYRTVTASAVGVRPNVPLRPAKRACCRCGIDVKTGGRTDFSKPALCGECKRIAPHFAD